MIELRVLGPLDLRDGTGSEIGRLLAQPKRLALLAYLALTHSTQRRDSLLGLFWPDYDEERARLALRQALHFLRSTLGADAIAGRTGEELALGENVLRCDAVEFGIALDQGRFSEALALYRGDLLTGFHVSDVSAEFDQWLERERQQLRARAARAAWALADQVQPGTDGLEAAHWARQAVQLAPDDEAGFRRLVSLLDRIGDRKGALRTYADFASRLRDEFGVEPAAETRALLRQVTSRETIDAPSDQLGSARDRRQPAAPAAAPPPARRAAAGPRPRWSIRLALTVAGIAVLGTGLAVRWAPWSNPLPRGTIAVGFIQNEGGDSTAEAARLLTGLLATDLARVRGLPVVSDTRLYEILGQLGDSPPTRESYLDAARRAGAEDLVEGVLYRRPEGVLRLDLRRVRVRSGTTREAYSAEGTDPFDLADRITARIAETFALEAPGTPLAATAVGSIVARRLYEQGLRGFYRGEWRGAYQLFSAALAEDSTFAMAAYYAARSIRWTRTDSEFVLLARAERLAGRAPLRDRLIIAHARHQDDYRVRAAVAESLAVQFPNEPDGLLAMATLRVADGDFAGALPFARRVITMDSVSLQGKTPICRACEAFEVLIGAYAAIGTDSFPAVERAAREWIERQPRAASGWLMLAGALTWRGRRFEALASLQRATQLEPALAHNYAHPSTQPAVIFATAVIAGEDYAEAARTLRDRGRFDERDLEAIWWLVTTLRHQGRITEALALARQAADFAGSEGRSRALWEYVEAVLLFDQRRYREAADRFQALARAGPGGHFDPYATRRVSWYGAHAATALAAEGDTVPLPALADTMERSARFGSSGLDRRLTHHVRGLLWQSRGQPARAVEDFRAAIYSPTLGFTRTNLEMGRVLLSLGRPRDAIGILREGLGGSSDGPGFFLTRTEVHEWLARGFEAAGRPDSAAAYYRRVAAAWKGGDPPYRVRAAVASRKAQALDP